MAYYYSASERAFFSSEIMSVDAMPSDKVAVADQTYKQLMADQVAGKLIRTGSGNAPESVDQGLTAATRFGDVSFGKVTGTNLDINGNGDVSGTFVVGGAVTIKGALNAQGGLNVTSITATGTSTLAAVNATNLSLSGTLKVNGASTLQAVSAKKITATEIDLNGSMDASGNVVVHGKTTLESLQANGDATIGGLLKVTGKAIVEDIAIRGSSTDFAGDRGQIGDCLEATDIDFNEYTHSGVWRIGGTYQNAGAFGNVTGYLIVYGNRAQNYALQIFARTLNSDAFCIRTLHGSSGWQPWRKVILETGGDLTGDLSTTGSFTSYNIRGFRHQYSGIDRDVIPSSQQQIFPYALLDKNGKTVSMYKVIQNTSRVIATQIGTVRSGDDGETEYALVEIGFDSEGVAYANVPSTPNDANNNRAATSKFVNDRISAHDSTVVHKTGSEIVEGTKTFDSSIVSKAVALIQSTNWEGIRISDTSRASNSTKMLAQILDADGRRWVGLETTASIDGGRTVQLIGRNRDNTDWLNFIRFFDRADGTFGAYLARSPVTSSDDNSIATTAWVRALFEAGLGSAIPSGVAFPYAGKTVPSGFMACNGGAISRTTYAKLFAAIGTAWGAGDGSTTFKLPDWRNRTVMGANTASEVGTYLESGAPNITGFITGGGQSYTTQYGGAFYEYGGSTDTADSGHSTVPVVGFDASRSNPIYGNAEIIQPPAGKALWIIKV